MSMKLRADGFKPGPELVGTVVVLTDEGEPTGVEHSGNYSRSGADRLLKKLESAGFDPETIKSGLTDLLGQLRQNSDTAASDSGKDFQPVSDLPIIMIDDRSLHDLAEESWEVLNEEDQS